MEQDRVRDPELGQDPLGQDPLRGVMEAVEGKARPLRRNKQARDRTWRNRHKVSACTSALFPWEVVVGHLSRHPRSLILMQMVNRPLRQLLASSHAFWQGVYKRNFFYKAYLTKQVRDPRFPQLKLWKNGPLELAYYIGPLHVDPGVPAVDLPPKEVLTGYIRKWFALKHGTRCGLCGCRYRHDVHWSLGRRVCRLCIAGNVVGASELHGTYGLDYSLISKRVARRVWYFSEAPHPGEDKMPWTAVKAGDARAPQLLFWRPHLEAIFDLPACRREQARRRDAAGLLASVVRRSWLFRTRVWLEQHARRSIDCFLVRVNRNERVRCLAPYASFKSATGGPHWAFPEAREHTRYMARTGESVVTLYRRMGDHEDWCVE